MKFQDISYYSWFNKIIICFIKAFLLFSVISTLFVFTYPLQGFTKTIVFACEIIVYFVFFIKFKDKISDYLTPLIVKLEKLDNRKMLIIIAAAMILFKIIFTIFFYFDPTLRENDISIYNNIANNILANGMIGNNEISHLLGIASHLAFFKLINIPNHIGVFIFFLIGTLVNFISFKEIIGKEKAFLLIMFYILMPSTTMLTFCPTHELFVYCYISLSLFMINRVIKENSSIMMAIYFILSIMFIVLTCFVNPAGNLVNIILVLIVLLSNIRYNKKILLAIILVLSLLGSNFVSKAFEMNKKLTETNTISILICGSSVETNGEHVDYYPANKAKALLKSRGIEYNADTQLSAYKEILIVQYKYLLTHPLELGKLLVHKFYVEWSGDHYSLEMAYDSNALSTFEYFLMLGTSAIIYMLVLSFGLIGFDSNKDNIYATNYLLLLLGVVALLLVTLVLNKYSTYATIFAFFASFYFISFSNESDKKY